MPTLRLVDPNGYSVPGGTRPDVTPETDAATRQELRTLADDHASEWADFGYDARLYQVVTDPNSDQL